MNFEQRIIRFFRELTELIVENIWTFAFIIWMLNGLLGITVTSDDKPKDQQTPQVQQPVTKEDGPKASM
jgi:hypothetical protein